MRTIAPITGVVVANSGITLMARMVGQNGQLVTIASITSPIQYSVRDLTAGSTTTALATLGTPASLLYDNLQQNDPRWSIDSADEPGEDGRHGYNFLATLDSGLFTAFDVESEEPYKVTPHRWQVSVVFTPVSGEPWHVPFQFTAVPTWV